MVVFISEFTRDDVGKHLKTDHRETQVIYNGIALSDEEPAPFPLPTERKFLLSIGKFHSRKNLLSLVRMMTSWRTSPWSSPATTPVPARRRSDHLFASSSLTIGCSRWAGSAKAEEVAL